MVTELDATGLTCPLPVLRARKALKDVPPGGELVVKATDPAARADFDAFCEATGCTLLAAQDKAGVLTLRLRKPAQ